MAGPANRDRIVAGREADTRHGVRSTWDDHVETVEARDRPGGQQYAGGASVVAFASFDHDHAVAASRQLHGRRRSCRPPTDDEGVGTG
jgi:hypothetical protein